jgi:single-stranded DNA-binding protein
LRVVAEGMQLLGSRSEPEAAASPAVPRRPSSAAPAPRPQPPKDPDLDAEPDDIPF